MRSSARAVMLKGSKGSPVFSGAANNKANSASATVVVPLTALVGDVFLVQLTQNNTNAITASPSTLNLMDTNLTVAAYPNHLYWGVIDGVTIVPGSTLSWSLSATRQWSLVLASWTNVDSVNPIHLYSVAAVAGSTETIPSLTTTITSMLVEIATGKGNGTTITSWIGPGGVWTNRSVAPGAGTFGGSAVIGDRPLGVAPAGTYGGETYTPSSAPGATVRYMVALKPA